jgi:hypothetical protein
MLENFKSPFPGKVNVDDPTTSPSTSLALTSTEAAAGSRFTMINEDLKSRVLTEEGINQREAPRVCPVAKSASWLRLSI